MSLCKECEDVVRWEENTVRLGGGGWGAERTDRKKNQLKGHKLGLEGEDTGQPAGRPGSSCSG